MNFQPEQIKKIKDYVAQSQLNIAGIIIYQFLPIRKKVVMTNLQLVFGDILSLAEREKLAKAFYSHIVKSLKECLIYPFLSKKACKKRVESIGIEYVESLYDSKSKGIIIITGHFGNWEFAPMAGIVETPALRNRFYTVRKRLSPRWLEKIIFRRQTNAGIQIIFKDDALETICQKLESNNAVVIVMDQYASSKDGIMVDFFREKAPTYCSIAMLARYMEVPILSGRSYRRKDGKHIIEYMPPLEWISHPDPREEIYLNTRQYNAILEKIIIDHPEQWLWGHKRWSRSFYK